MTEPEDRPSSPDHGTADDGTADRRRSSGLRSSATKGSTAGGSPATGIRISARMSEEEARQKEAEVHEALQTLDRSRRRHRRWFIAAAILLAIVLLAIHQVSVMGYAVLTDLEVTQSSENPSRIRFVHTAVAPGKVAYYYEATCLTSELEESETTDFGWTWESSGDSFVIRVRSRWLVFPRWDRFEFRKSGAADAGETGETGG